MIEVMQKPAANHQIKSIVVKGERFGIALHIFQMAHSASLETGMLTREIHHVP
jgi:hypothetical protein